MSTKSYLKLRNEEAARPGPCLVMRPARRGGKVKEVACLLAPKRRAGRRAAV